MVLFQIYNLYDLCPSLKASCSTISIFPDIGKISVTKANDTAKELWDITGRQTIGDAVREKHFSKMHWYM